LFTLVSTAGVATAAPPAVAALAIPASPVPAGGYGWKDCGPKICTFYFTRKATLAVDKYFRGVPDTGILSSVACGVIGYFLKNPFAGIAGGSACDLFMKRFDWKSSAATAAKAKACFQVAYPNVAWYRRSITQASAGWTNNSRYCFN
jgi:hypothetical protein